MGYVMLGIGGGGVGADRGHGAALTSSASRSKRSTTTAMALNGAALQMFNHGIITGVVLLVGVIYERAHRGNGQVRRPGDGDALLLRHDDGRCLYQPGAAGSCRFLGRATFQGVCAGSVVGGVRHKIVMTFTSCGASSRLSS